MARRFINSRRDRSVAFQAQAVSELPERITLASRQFEPARCLAYIHRGAPTFFEEMAIIELTRGIPLVGGQFEIARGF
jgi:hypothetical protein